MKRDKAIPLMIFLLASLTLPLAALVSAAEVRGTVSIEYQGLFERGGAIRSHPVSVALLPALADNGLKLSLTACVRLS
jgi:hypothetical protein